MTNPSFRFGKKVSAAHGASKAALAQRTCSAALDRAAHNIRFNCVVPGSTDTAMPVRVIRDLSERSPGASGTGPEAAETAAVPPAVYTAAVPLGCFAAPEEIAAVTAYVASDAANFVTGVVMPVDGGTTAA